MKKILIYVFLLVLMVIVYFVDIKKSWGIFLKNDYKIAVMADDGIGLVSISPNRGMVNYLEISGDSFVWIPNGYGWYASKKISRLLDQEKKKNMVFDIFFYNFGFEADTVLWVDKVDNWDKLSNLSKGLGYIPSFFASFKFNDMFFKQDLIEGDLTNNLLIDEILRREFASDVLIEDGVRLSVYNDSGQNNLATWMADRFNWVGLAVLSVGDWQGDTIDNCKVFYNKNLSKAKTIKFIKNRFEKCEYTVSDDVSDTEIEIVLGKSWAEMINYNSYVRTF